MKTIRRLFALSALAGLLSVAHATVLLTDDFSGASLDASKWSTILPFAGSSVVQGGGVVTTTGRGILGTNAGFDPAITISGSFTMQSDLEHFIIGFRTNLSVLPDPLLFNTLSGMFVEFANDGNGISIQGFGFSAQPTSHKLYPLETGQAYSFMITDTGSEISLAINGVTELTAITSLATGNQVAFYSREFPSTSTRLDNVTITGVPDGGSTVVYFGFAGLLMMFCARASSRHRSA